MWQCGGNDAQNVCTKGRRIHAPSTQLLEKHDVVDLILKSSMHAFSCLLHSTDKGVQVITITYPATLQVTPGIAALCTSSTVLLSF